MPQLSSLILFVDQYRDVYVEDDFARLMANPPKVMRTHRLLDRIQSVLLPKRYRKPEVFPFTRHDGTPDQLSLYVRR